MSENDDVRAELQHLAERRRQATDAHREASSELRDVVQRAVAADIPMAEIARLAGISRQGLYKLLRSGD